MYCDYERTFKNNFIDVADPCYLDFGLRATWNLPKIPKYTGKKMLNLLLARLYEENVPYYSSTIPKKININHQGVN